MADLVSLTIDGRDVEAPKGQGLVETAMQAGIEIPVFCYEPRLGPAVGACRMCLVEVEGIPKLQAGCTLTAQDGMVVKTAQTSEKAAEGQHGTLEFLLVNHPLDCPVCDKGGECPLQDLTFRWGPGKTRMTFMKRTFDKPIPISPLIALDRERCILCYRCTRFSEGVAEDGQLIARNRGAHSMIATFEDEPYRAPFSGNVIELCPVGALTSTAYRFEARPWEIQNVPSICTLCPVGCNISVTTREGKVKRIQSRNHPEVDEGWLCDKGRFAWPAISARDRVTAPMARSGEQLAEVTWEQALDAAEALLRESRGQILTALSGSETLEQAYALGRLLRGGLDAHSAVLPELTSPALDAYRAPLSAIGAAQLVVVIGDDPVAERAPIVDLWIRSARRRGAEIVSVGVSGSVQAPAGNGAAACRRLADRRSPLGRRLREAERAVVIWSGPGGRGGEHLARLAGALGFAEREGCGAFYLPVTPNGLGVTEAWAGAADGDETDPEPLRLLVVSGDDAAADPNVRLLAERADKVLVFAMYRRGLAAWADVVIPATSYLERDGTTMNLEGRLQRQRRAVIPPATDETAVVAELGRRLGVDIPGSPIMLFEELSERIYGGMAFDDVTERAALPARTPPAELEPATAPDDEVPTDAGAEGLRLVGYRPLFSGPAVERVAELGFQRPEREIALSPRDAAARGIATGDPVVVRTNGTSVELRARVERALAPGHARVAEEHCRGLGRYAEIELAVPE